METRANYVVTGAFTLAVIAGVFSFIFWFHNSGSGGERASYRVVFTGSVSGLRSGCSVLFNGIRVGEVSGLALDAHDPRKVVATISVDRAVPVRADTKVALAFQGLTGLAEVALTGGAVDAALLAADAAAPPTLYAEPSAGADVTQAARDVLSRIDGLVADNETALRSSLRNIETVTSTLAQNSERLDKVMAGLENLTGSGDRPRRDRPGRGGDRASSRKISTSAPTRFPSGSRRFSNSGLKEFEAFAVDGRRTLAELNKAIKNIDQHPTRLIFGQ